MGGGRHRAPEYSALTSLARKLASCLIPPLSTRALIPAAAQIAVNGTAIQCRITTEDPARNFAPDSGLLSVYRSATGNGMCVQGWPRAECPAARKFKHEAGPLTHGRPRTHSHRSPSCSRIDDGPGYPGATVQPFYDSLLTKVTAHASSFDGAVHKLTRALREHRIRGVTTNISCVTSGDERGAARAAIDSC